MTQTKESPRFSGRFTFEERGGTDDPFVQIYPYFIWMVCLSCMGEPALSAGDEE